MKCLQCGNELDRLAKRKGAVDFCSEKCRKIFDDECNRLAMSRLMELPRRGASRRAAAATLTQHPESTTPVALVVPEPAPRIDSPPTAEFLFEVPATLAVLGTVSAEPICLENSGLVLPHPDLDWAENFIEFVRGLRPPHPQARPAVPLRFSVAASFVTAPAPVPPPCDLPHTVEWAASLGSDFLVTGIGLGSHTAVPSPGVSTAPVSAGASATQAAVSHNSIPPLRQRIPYRLAPQVIVPMDPRVPAPAISAPRLRIHLPKPTLLTLRPRFAFAPPPVEGHAATPLSGTTTHASVPQIPESPKSLHPVPEVEAPSIFHDAVPPSEPKAERISQVNNASVAPERKPEPVNRTAPPTFGMPPAEAPADLDPPAERFPGWAKAAVIIALVIGGGSWYYGRSPGMTAPRNAILPADAIPQITMGPDTWSEEWAGDTGGAERARQIRLYKPSRRKRDYTLEFSADIRERAVGWVFRARDTRNYYLMKIEVTGNGLNRKASLIRSAILDGSEYDRVVKPLPEGWPEGRLGRGQLDVRGSRFTFHWDGKLLDSWTDSRLQEGSLGLSNERGERGIVRSLKVTY